MAPAVSLILCVKNGLPYLSDALASVAAQTYRDFELVVQDGGSTDGSLDVLEDAVGIPQLSVVSEPDGGIGDAYNRAVGRCTGAIVGSIDSDNVLEPDALERIVPFLRARPSVAAVYGGSNLLTEQGEVLYPWMPQEPHLLRLLTCELVPPFAASFFNREVCGDELRFDPSLRTCADFDLWLRLWHMPISRVPHILAGTRLSQASMTRRPETYDQFIADKSSALERYLAGFEPSHLVDAVRVSALAGIHAWAAESVFGVEGRRSPQFERYLARALELDPGSPRAAAASALPAQREAGEQTPALPEQTPESTEGETPTEQAPDQMERAPDPTEQAPAPTNDPPTRRTRLAGLLRR